MPLALRFGGRRKAGMIPKARQRDVHAPVGHRLVLRLDEIDHRDERPRDQARPVKRMPPLTVAALTRAERFPEA